MLLQIALGSGLLVLNVILMALAALMLESGVPQHPSLADRAAATAEAGPDAGGGRAVGAGGRCCWCLGLGGQPALSGLSRRWKRRFTSRSSPFSTLGLGDVVPHPEWRIFAVMAAVNGFLSFGLLTALLVEALRQVGWPS